MLNPYTITALVLVLLIFGYLRGNYGHKKALIAYQELEDKFNLTLNAKRSFFVRSLELKGTIDGYQFKIFEENRSDGDEGTDTYTIITFVGQLRQFNYTIRRENMLTKIGSAIGVKDIQVGHDFVDKKYRFKSNRSALLQAICDYEVQSRLEANLAQFKGDLKHSPTKLKYETTGRLHHNGKYEEIVTTIELMRLLLGKEKALRT